MKPAPAQVVFTTSEALERIRQSWLSNFSHSLSGPLFAARGYIRLALQSDDGALSDSHKNYLARALENVNQLVLLVRELNDFPPHEGGELGSYSFDGALEEALAQTRKLFSAGNVKLVHQLAHELLVTFGDRRAVLQALCDLLSVAVQFADLNGLVELSETEENGQIVFRLAAGPARSSELAPDLSAPTKSWRLQGGSIHACVSDGRLLLTCELPVIRTNECQDNTGAL